MDFPFNIFNALRRFHNGNFGSEIGSSLGRKSKTFPVVVASAAGISCCEIDRLHSRNGVHLPGARGLRLPAITKHGGDSLASELRIALDLGHGRLRL